ncbi:YidB family protein [Asticcacaulis sp.]|uniref:YidB family protein n=1 Tax=Asticcacaulis sp. TaxID=1872648 RepID=UPI002CAF35FF|nr:YidB family protein [Asticcacaulis sp.]HTM79752.1 YidB family protein [Asticcacaulis sp.]
MSLLNDMLGAASGPGGFDIEKLAGQLGNGGLNGLVAKFEKGGMGEIVQSWVGTGGNLPISADQIQSVLGSEQVASLTKAMGIDSSQLASALPGLIDHLTPGGQLPQGNITDVVLQAAKRGGFGDALGGLFKA